MLARLWTGWGRRHPFTGKEIFGIGLEDTIGTKFYYTGKSPRALWQRFRIWRAYRRPVNFHDLRKLAHAAAYPHRDPRRPHLTDLNRPDPAGIALFDAVVHRAEGPVFGD